MIFISKMILIILFFIFSNYVYEKSNWSKSKGSTLQYIYAAIVAIPFGLTLMYLFYNNIFVTMEFLNTRSYWEQIILIFGFITIFFGYRIYLQELKFKKEIKQKVIDEQSNTIRLLKEFIETIQTDEEPIKEESKMTVLEEYQEHFDRISKKAEVRLKAREELSKQTLSTKQIDKQVAESYRIHGMKNPNKRSNKTIMNDEEPKKPKPTLEQKLAAYKKLAAWTKAQKDLKEKKNK